MVAFLARNAYVTEVQGGVRIQFTVDPTPDGETEVQVVLAWPVVQELIPQLSGMLAVNGFPAPELP